MKKQRILFDQDGTLNNFTAGIEDFLQEHFPGVDLARHSYNFAEGISDQVAAKAAEDHMNSPGFYRNLAPVPAAMQAYRILVALGHEVAVCTHPVAPRDRLVGCMEEKVAWTVEHLGQAAADKMIFSFDKTREFADVIIDDKPDLTHKKTEIRFRHWLIVDHPYNQTLPETLHLPIGRINNNWSNWEEEFVKLELI